MAARRTVRSAPAAALKLSEGEIVQAALRLTRRTGADKISMRGLAAELGVSPMAIYYHVPNKDALLDLVVDAVLLQVPTPTPDPKRWQAQLKAASLAAFALLAAYPGVSHAMITRGNTKAGRMLMRYCITILLAAGFEERKAALAIAAYNTYMYGLYAGLDAMRRAKPQERATARAGRAAAGRSDGVSAVVAQMRALGVEQAIEFGIDAMLSGITALSGKRPRARKK
jgi:AcrR family transcriptional regulator